MTPDEARQSITDLYAATRAALGGHWTVGAQTWLDCTDDPNAAKAAFQFGAQRRDQALPGTPKEVAEAVRALWDSRGIPAGIFFDRSISHYEVSYPRFGRGAAPDGYLVQLTIADRYVGFSGASRCVPGDSLELDFSEVGRAVE